MTLRGDPSLHIPKLSLKSLQPEFSVQDKGVELGFNSVAMQDSEEVKIPSEIEDILQEFAVVFQEPKGLPPVIGREHSISHQLDIGPISVRPYIYPHAHKKSNGEIGPEDVGSWDY